MQFVKKIKCDGSKQMHTPYLTRSKYFLKANYCKKLNKNSLMKPVLDLNKVRTCTCDPSTL